MTIVSLQNYTGTNQPVYADNDQDLFNRTHVANTSLALETHDHTLTKGLPVSRVATSVMGQATAFFWALGVL